MSGRKSRLALGLVLIVVASGAALLSNSGAGPDMTLAAQRFLELLSDEQRATATMEFGAPARLAWHFIPKAERKGVQLRDMSARQQGRARKLLESCLSQVGYDKATEIMTLEEILNKLEGPDARFKRDPLRYYFTVFGKPSAESRWGLSIEGHHLSLNFVVENNRVVAHTPAFFGANPGLVMSEVGVGPKKGTRTLAKEETLAFDLLASLTPEQRKTAIIAEQAPRDIRAAGEAQPPVTPPEGIAAADLTDAQVKTLQALIDAHIRSMPAEVADARLEEIREAGVGKVHFAWAGADKPGVGHYYRLQGPTFLVEFCNTQPDAAGNPANHIHAVWRNMNGDFGLPLDK